SIGGRELARQIAQLDSVLPALHEHLRLALASLEGEQQYVPLADRMTDLLRALDALDTNLRHISEGELQCSGAPQHELAQLFETLQHDSYASFTEDEFGAMELSLHREFRKDGLLDDYVAKRGNVVDQLNYFLIEAQHS
ncbi:MAG: hypothetical protein KDD62_10820, partial [Bdellovibrionales bacterium]|nr:hypothetical protein [Bdellovibrionales bacterium]